VTAIIREEWSKMNETSKKPFLSGAEKKKAEVASIKYACQQSFCTCTTRD
jgi:hypothetical protein